jgi:3-hydroxy-3-methylglutaryl CoA synthase
MSLTYGWYENQILSAGFDVGAEATRTGLGPTTRFTLGAGGIAFRVTGGVTFEPDPHVVASAEVVLELADIVGVL